MHIPSLTAVILKPGTSSRTFLISHSLFLQTEQNWPQFPFCLFVFKKGSQAIFRTGKAHEVAVPKRQESRFCSKWDDVEHCIYSSKKLGKIFWTKCWLRFHIPKMLYIATGGLQSFIRSLREKSLVVTEISHENLVSLLCSQSIIHSLLNLPEKLSGIIQQSISKKQTKQVLLRWGIWEYWTRFFGRKLLSS
jgi:hypothetical protein